MKKIFLMGRSEAGKTSLTQALKGEKLHYVKTQYTNTDDDTIDSPGGYDPVVKIPDQSADFLHVFFSIGTADQFSARSEHTLNFAAYS